MNDRILSSTVLGLLLGVLLAACGGGSGGAGTGSNDTNSGDTGSIVISTNGTGTIGAAGGTITTPDGVSVMVPAGATTDAVTLRIAKDSTDAPRLPELLPPISPVYEITPHIPQLNGLARLKLPFDASKLAEGSAPQVVIVEPGGEWTVIEQATVEGSVVTVPTNHFSYVYVGNPQMCTIPTGCGKSKNVPVVTRALNADHAPVELNPGQWDRKIRVEQSTKFDLRLTVDPGSFVPDHFGTFYCSGSAELGVEVIGTRSSDPTQRVGHFFQRQFIQKDFSNFTASFPFEMTSADNGLYRIRVFEYCRFGETDPDAWYGCAPETCMGRYRDWIYMEVNIQAPPSAPTINRHPQGLTVVAGQAASFTAAGSSAASQTIGWERSNDSGNTWSEVQAAVSAQTSTYTLNSTVIADDGAMFRAVFCNTSGSKQTCIKSAIAELTVVPVTVSPSFARQPVSVSVPAGQMASLTAAAVGTPPPEIRFYRAGGAGVADLEIKICPASGGDSVTACSYSTGALTKDQSGMEFYARATNSAGTVDSSHAIVTVTNDAAAPVIVTQPSGATSYVGGAASFRIVASGTAALSYQWRFNGAPLADRAGDAGISAIRGSNSATLTLGNVQMGDVGAYTVVVNNSVGSVTSNEATLAVLATPPDSWTRQVGSSGNDLRGLVAADLSGAVYLAGTTGGAMDGNASAGRNDAFIARYSATGERKWIKQWGTEYDDSVTGIATDASGNVYVVGNTWGNLGGNVNAGGGDVFVAKYDTGGTLLWSRLLGSAGMESGYGIAVDGGGNVLITGETFDNLSGISNSGNNDAFIAKYDTSGNLLWTRLTGTAEQEQGLYVATDGSNVYVVGRGGSLNGSPSPQVFDHYFIAMYDKDGILQWSKEFGGGLSAYANGVAADSLGNVFVGGHALAGNYFESFLTKYDVNGDTGWTKKVALSGFNVYGEGVAVDASGNVMLVGETDGALGSGSNQGGHDIYLATFGASDGTQQSIRQYGTSGSDLAYSVAAGVNQVVFVGGETDAATEGNSNAGGQDVFVHMFPSP